MLPGLISTLQFLSYVVPRLQVVRASPRLCLAVSLPNGVTIRAGKRDSLQTVRNVPNSTPQGCCSCATEESTTLRERASDQHRYDDGERHNCYRKNSRTPTVTPNALAHSGRPNEAVELLHSSRIRLAAWKL